MTKSLVGFTAVVLFNLSRTLYAVDGVYASSRLEHAEAAVESGQLVLRHPLMATNAPKALGVLLVDAEPSVKLARDCGAFFVEQDHSVSTAPHRMFVMLADRPNREVELRLVLNGEVFWQVEPDDLIGYWEKGWISFLVRHDQNPTAVLRAAGVVFGVPEAEQYDLRLTEVQRARVADIGGDFPRAELEAVRRVVTLMAGRQLLRSLVLMNPDGWQRELTNWPGRHPLKIRGDRKGAAVYYSPNRGFQLEKREGKWAVVGG